MHKSHLKQLDICVEQVTLGDVDSLDAQLVHQAQDAGGDGRLPAKAQARRFWNRLRMHMVMAIFVYKVRAHRFKEQLPAAQQK